MNISNFIYITKFLISIRQSGDSYLSIDSPDESSEGNYTCKASNKAGSNKANVYLTINGNNIFLFKL